MCINKTKESNGQHTQDSLFLYKKRQRGILFCVLTNRVKKKSRKESEEKKRAKVDWRLVVSL